MTDVQNLPEVKLEGAIKVERYEFKFKDKDHRNAVEIRNPNGSDMVLAAIRILKVPKTTNKIVVELEKAK